MSMPIKSLELQLQAFFVYGDAYGLNDSSFKIRAAALRSMKRRAGIGSAVCGCRRHLRKRRQDDTYRVTQARLQG
ncbi:hypothetical protein CNECB9_3760075 [Cupriavidus necator]|uniref:Uncharacterized protein n=1 Tax=Cupriavidus necator TaxID=106590 RepID=A0A1K0JQH0_CUPNE|nr:hypothetical protein CNECB9_3760075 [Cupriavidus necator]